MRAICIRAEQIDGMTDIVHNLLFHGDATWEDKLDAHQFINILENTPIQIKRSGRDRSAVFMPGANLVVEDSVKSILESQFGLYAHPVEFSKLIDLWYEPGDFGYYNSTLFRQNPAGCRPDLILDILPDAPALHTDFPKYHNLDLVNLYANGLIGELESFVQIPGNDIDDEYGTTPWRAGLLHQYPIIWSGVVLLRADVYDLLEPVLDKRFFAVVELDLP